MESLTYEYQIGDRVRALAGVDGIPEGTKGNVIHIGNNTLHVEAKVNNGKIVGLFSPDQLEQVIPIKGSTGDLERTRHLHNVDYAGTNLPEELAQVWQHINEMMCVGYPYLNMEKHLMSLGFGLNVIRKAFKALTGISAEDAVNFNYQFSPGNIPQFNLGWGYSKDGKGTCFIMPGVNWYSIMHQEDDMTRVEVGKFYTLPEAVEEMKKKVKEFQQWNPPVNELKLDKKHKPKLEMGQMYRQPQLFMQASGKLLNVLRNTASATERTGLINEAYLSGLINEESRDSLKRVFADDAESTTETDAALEKLDDIEQDTISKPIQEEISEKTPGQFFEKKKMEKKYSVLPADVIASVSEYISNSNAQLKDFDLGISSFKYSTIQPAGTKQSTPGDEPDIMNAIASVSVLLEVMDKKGGGAKKLGLMVFSVIQSNIYTTDTVKGEDDWIYAISDEGLGKYFQAERELAVQKS